MKKIKRFFVFFLRLLANNCISLNLRLYLFRLSGVKIGGDAIINMGLHIIDNYLGNGSVTIGDRVDFGPNITLITNSGPTKSKLRKIKKYAKKFGKIMISDDAWIGTGVIILPGIKIGKAAVVGAGSIVTKDIPNYWVVAGNPAKKIGEINPADIRLQ